MTDLHHTWWQITAGLQIERVYRLQQFYRYSGFTDYSRFTDTEGRCIGTASARTLPRVCEQSHADPAVTVAVDRAPERDVVSAQELLEGFSKRGCVGVEKRSTGIEATFSPGVLDYFAMMMEEWQSNTLQRDGGLNTPRPGWGPLYGALCTGPSCGVRDSQGVEIPQKPTLIFHR